MIERHVPAGTEAEFAGAPYKTVGSLPAIIAKRQGNRGIEGIAISPDERFLYFIMQNPLANPDTAAFQQARNTRLFKLERATMKVVGEYVYTLDDPQSFRRDPSRKQSDPRISELMAIGLDRLIVLTSAPSRPPSSTRSKLPARPTSRAAAGTTRRRRRPWSRPTWRRRRSCR